MTATFQPANQQSAVVTEKVYWRAAVSRVADSSRAIDNALEGRLGHSRGYPKHARSLPARAMRQRVLALAAIVATGAVGSVSVPSVFHHRVRGHGETPAQTRSIRVVVNAGAAGGYWPGLRSDELAKHLADAALLRNPDIVASGQVAREIAAAQVSSRLFTDRSLTDRRDRAEAVAARIMRFLRAQRTLLTPAQWTEQRGAGGQIVIEIGFGAPP